MLIFILLNPLNCYDLSFLNQNGGNMSIDWHSNKPYECVKFGPIEQKRLEPLSRISFSQLIEKKSQDGMPYILGITTDDCFNSEMDGVKLYKSNGINPYTGNKIKEIFYYTIVKGQNELQYLGTSNETNPELKKYLNDFFAANEGDQAAQLKLGDLYHTRKEYDNALTFYKQPAKLGSKEGMEKCGKVAVELGDDYFNKKEYTKAVENYKLALNYNISSDQKEKIYSRLGDLYLSGLGVEKNFLEAVKYFDLLSNKKDHPTALLILAGNRALGKRFGEAISLINQYSKSKQAKNVNLEELFSWIEKMKTYSNDKQYLDALTHLKKQCWFFKNYCPTTTLKEITNKSKTQVANQIKISVDPNDYYPRNISSKFVNKAK